ncbi:MAG: PAS domain-containing protein, partial [Roseimicrobium sp.]
MKSPQGSKGKQPAGVQAAILQFAELFEGLDDVQFWIKDRRGQYLHVNRAFLLNYDLVEPTQVVGKTDYDLSPAFLADQFLLDDERVLKGHKVVGRIELVSGADQAARWNVTHKLPLRDTRGHIMGTTGTTRPLKAGERSL